MDYDCRSSKANSKINQDSDDNQDVLPMNATHCLPCALSYYGYLNTSGIRILLVSPYFSYHRSTFVTSEQMKAARALLGWNQNDLANASGVSLPTVKRLEAQPGDLMGLEVTIVALRRALEKAGIAFISENGGGAGVRLRRRRR